MIPELLIKKLEADEVEDFKVLIELFIKVFEDERAMIPSHQHLVHLLSMTHFHAFVVKKRDQFIGGVTAYELRKYYSEKSELYLYDVAISSEYQGKGIGKQLIDWIR